MDSQAARARRPGYMSMNVAVSLMYNTRTMSQKQNYYHSFVGEDGKLDHSIEEFLGKIESAAMPMITRIAAGNVQLTWEERGWLARALVNNVVFDILTRHSRIGIETWH